MCKPISFKIWYVFKIAANYRHKINVYKTFLYCQCSVIFNYIKSETLSKEITRTITYSLLS